MEDEDAEVAEELKEEYTSGMGRGGGEPRRTKREKNNHRGRGFVYEPRVGKLRDARLRNACVRS